MAKAVVRIPIHTYFEVTVEGENIRELEDEAKEKALEQAINMDTDKIMEKINSALHHTSTTELDIDEIEE